MFIDGELDYQEWEDRSSGQKRSALRVRAQTVTFESSGAAGKSTDDIPVAEARPRATSEPSDAPEPPDDGTASADDLPF